VSELFSEIDEDLRREQLKKLWDRYSLHIIALIVLTVVGVGGWRGYEYVESQKAEAAGKEFEAALALTDPAQAQAAFDKIASSNAQGYSMLARLHAASEAAKQDSQKGIAAFDAIANDGKADGPLREIARIRAASLLLDTAPYADIEKRLSGDASGTHTFRHSAREVLALSAWRAKNNDAARKWLDMIGEDPQSPATLRRRAEAMLALLPPAAKS
jgi:hypothetical protein